LDPKGTKYLFSKWAVYRIDMEKHRYILDKSPKKYTCPGCGKKRFVRYIDTVTGEYLTGDYGRCDREGDCKYFQRPPLETRCFFVPFTELKDYSEKAFQLVTDAGTYFVPKSQVFEALEGGCYITEFYLNESDKAPGHLANDYKYYSDAGTLQIHSTETMPQKQKVYFLPEAVLSKTLKGYENNTFIQNLLKRYPAKEIEKVVSLYRLGTVASGYRAGAVTFPFIDRAGSVRTIQAKQFDETNHTTSTDFIHSMIERHHTKAGEPLPGWLQDYKLNEKFVTCLFGEHLLNRYPMNPVALVEAPKTAVIGTLCYGLPDSPNGLLWLAVYNKSSLTLEKCKVLKGRKVVLFPDLNAFDEWNQKAKEINASLPGTRFVVSDLLERNATETDIKNGLDLADYLTRFDYRLFRKEKQPVEAVTPPPAETPAEATKTSLKAVVQEYSEPLPIEPKPENWEQEIKELEAYFSGINPPVEPIKLNTFSTITNISVFIEGHLATIKANNGNRTYLPFLNRLQELKQLLTINLN
jgi:hypothetical protein